MFEMSERYNSTDYILNGRVKSEQLIRNWVAHWSSEAKQFKRQIKNGGAWVSLDPGQHFPRQVHFVLFKFMPPPARPLQPFLLV